MRRTEAFPAVVVADRLVGPRPQPEDDGHVIREVEAVVVRQVQEGVEPAGVSPSVVVFPSDASCEVVRYEGVSYCLCEPVALLGRKVRPVFLLKSFGGADDTVDIAAGLQSVLMLCSCRGCSSLSSLFLRDLRSDCFLMRTYNIG